MRSAISEKAGGSATVLEFRSLELETGEEETGGGGPMAVLDFFMQRQEQTNWCWSAVATSVGLHFRSGRWTQCGVASMVFPGFSKPPGPPCDCCANGGTCNRYGYLDMALKATRSFAELQAGKPTFQEVHGQLAAGNPVGVRVAWFQGGAHFIAVCGCSTDEEGNQYLDVADPWTGIVSTQRADGPGGFPAGYSGGGAWTHTYFTEHVKD